MHLTFLSKKSRDNLKILEEGGGNLLGKIDEITEGYFCDLNRFADLWNAYLYRGEELIHPEELYEMDSVATGKTIKKNRKEVIRRKVITDKVMMWKGKCLRVLVLENQSYIDYRMVIRNMLTEAILYDKQVKNIQRNHIRKGELDNKYYLSGITKEDKLIPVITLVVNFSDEKWDGATSLYELLDLKNECNQCTVTDIKKFVTNYKLNLFDYHDYDDFNQFHTELKNLFEFLRFSENKEKIEECLYNDERYQSLDEETTKFIADLRKIKVKCIGGKSNMCKAFEDYKEEGKIEGRIETLKDSIIKLLNRIGKITEQLKNRINSEQNEQILDKMFDLALSSKTIAEFEKELMMI